jgi:hypothetical protein
LLGSSDRFGASTLPHNTVRAQSRVVGPFQVLVARDQAAWRAQQSQHRQQRTVRSTLSVSTCSRRPRPPSPLPAAPPSKWSPTREGAVDFWCPATAACHRARRRYRCFRALASTVQQAQEEGREPGRAPGRAPGQAHPHRGPQKARPRLGRVIRSLGPRAAMVGCSPPRVRAQVEPSRAPVAGWPPCMGRAAGRGAHDVLWTQDSSSHAAAAGDRVRARTIVRSSWYWSLGPESSEVDLTQYRVFACKHACT